MGKDWKYNIAAVGMTEQGKVRRRNEDSFHIDQEHRLFIVSDGMGGAPAGDLASETVVRVMPQVLEQNKFYAHNEKATHLRTFMRELIMSFSYWLYNESMALPGYQGMGATLVMAYIRYRWVHIAHMGDSRAYLLRGGVLARLTTDHSIIEMLLKQGMITEKQARYHPARGIITCHVGMEGVGVPDVRTVALLPGDRLLLCTDGLTGMLNDDQIADLLDLNPDPEKACESLIDAANNAGGMDNITVIVINWQ